MKRRKYLLISGAVLITLLMTSSATAVNYSNDQTSDEETGGEILLPPENDDEQQQQPDEESYVDPNIELTSIEHLPGLQTIVNKIDDPDFILFTQELINELNEDGTVDAQDIEAILNRHDFLAGSSVYRGFISGTAGGYTTACGFPYRPHLIRPRGADLMISWAGPGLAVWWDGTSLLCTNDIYLTIGGDTIEWKHKGMAFFQVGYWQCLGWRHGCALFQEYEFSITAWSPLVLIS